MLYNYIIVCYRYLCYSYTMSYDSYIRCCRNISAPLEVAVNSTFARGHPASGLINLGNRDYIKSPPRINKPLPLTKSQAPGPLMKGDMDSRVRLCRWRGCGRREHVRIYIYIYIYLYLSLSLYIYIYLYLSLSIYIYLYL